MPGAATKGTAGGFLGKLRIGHRLALALAVPALALVWFAAAMVVGDWQARTKAGAIREFALFLPNVGAAVHALQKERGLSAGFLASKGVAFADELKAQRAETDEVLISLEWRISLMSPKHGDEPFARRLGASRTLVGAIPDAREKVDRLGLGGNEAIGFYTDVVSGLIGLARRWAAMTDEHTLDHRVWAYLLFVEGKEHAGLERAVGNTGLFGGSALDRRVWTYLHLVEGKEHAGQERAVGNAGLSAGGFAPSFLKRFIELGAEQRTHFEFFRDIAGAAFTEELDAIENAPASLEVRRMRAIIVADPRGGGIVPGAWYANTTGRIDLLRGLELRLAASLDEAADETMRATGRSMALSLALLAAVLGLMGGGAAAVSRGVSRPIGRLAAAMERLAEGDDSVSIEGGDRRDEIGAMTRAFEVFRRSEIQVRLLAQAVEQTPAGIVITDPGGTIAYVNPAVTRLSGHDRDELIGANPRVFASGETSREQYERLWKAIGMGQVWKGEILNRRKDGAFVWEYEVIAPVFDRKGRITHYVGVKEDITARKKLDEYLHAARLAAEEANRSKSFFLANMSHELRTPLNAILGFSEAVMMGIPAPLGHPKHIEYIGLVHQSAGYLLQLINDILDLSKIESSVQVPQEARIRLPEVLDACIGMMRERAARKGIRVDSEIPDGCPCLTADERMIKQIVLNLLTNAIKFTPDGGTVSIRAAVDGGDLSIRVADTGIGIAPGDMTRIFTPFARAENDPYVRRQEGTGLGLVLTRKMAELHGGSLVLDSQPGQGTTATVRFPASRLSPPSVSEQGLRT